MSYLSKKGYVLKKENFTIEELFNIKKELRGRPLTDTKFSKISEDTTFQVYIETKNKLYIPKMYGIEKFGQPNSTLDNYNGHEWNHQIPFTGTLYENQIEPVNNLIEACHDKGGGILQLATGFGKCMKVDTPILMFDGSIQMIQDIKKGAFIMGDDSTSRKVLSLARGIDEMYDIIPTDGGEKYTVNQEHILCLKVSRKPTLSNINLNLLKVKWFNDNKYITKIFSIYNKKEALIFLKNIKQQEIMEISVKDYIKLPINIKNMLKGYKVPIEFNEIILNLDPYIIGFLLNNSLKNIDNQYVIDKLAGNEYNEFEHYSTLKHIPDIYKINSRNNRLQLLAGLIDSNGYLKSDKYTFEISQKSEKLINDIIYLCRSLGFSCYKSKQNDYYTISISGNTSEIPTLILNKQANKRMQMKNVSTTNINVKHVGKDNYYGFTLNGNSRYIIGDFTVTHNTISSLYVLSQLKGKTIIIVNKISLLEQWKNEISKFLPEANIGIIQGKKNIDVHDKDIVIAMLQSLTRIDYPDELLANFNVTLIDELQNLGSALFSKVLFKICSKYTIGLSATPVRADGCEYIFKWHIGDIVFKSTVERKGKPPIIRMLKIDSTEYKEVTNINRFTGQHTLQFTSMLSELIEMPKRNKLIIELIKRSYAEHRKILLLSDRRNHLTELKNLLDSENVSFTYGLFVGSMKIKDLEKSKACNVILATFAAFSEGVSEKDLDTLILTTPKKFIGHLKNSTKNESFKLEQIVGRIFRKEHTEKNPLIIDLQDNFSVYKNQASSRNIFYKSHFKSVIFENQTINLDDYQIQNINTLCINTKKIKEITNTPEITQVNNMLNFCILDD